MQGSFGVHGAAEALREGPIVDKVKTVLGRVKEAVLKIKDFAHRH